MCLDFQHMMEDEERRFYRQLFLRRYALLLEKAEHTFRVSPETMRELRASILCLDWVDRGVEKLMDSRMATPQ